MTPTPSRARVQSEAEERVPSMMLHFLSRKTGTSTSDNDEERAWRKEFETAGERQTHDTIYHGPGIYPDPKRLFALRWLRAKEAERERQEQKMRCYVRWTFSAAVAAGVAGIVGVLVTWFAR